LIIIPLGIIVAFIVWKIRQKQKKAERKIYLMPWYHSIKSALTGKWERKENQRYRLRPIKKGDEILDRAEYVRISSILEDHLHAQQSVAKDIYLIDCPHLARPFQDRRENMLKEPVVPKTDVSIANRIHVQEALQKMVQSYEWNQENGEWTSAPVVYGVHGTSRGAANKILERGFEILTKVDDGFYGQGIYFSSFLSYISPYAFVHKEPTAIISALLLGNSFPVIERKDSNETLLGAPISSTFQSNYVLVRQNGNIAPPKAKNPRDEIIIRESVQVLPVFMLILEKNPPKKKGKKTKNSNEKQGRKKALWSPKQIVKKQKKKKKRKDEEIEIEPIDLKPEETTLNRSWSENSSEKADYIRTIPAEDSLSSIS